MPIIFELIKKNSPTVLQRTRRLVTSIILCTVLKESVSHLLISFSLSRRSLLIPLTDFASPRNIADTRMTTI